MILGCPLPEKHDLKDALADLSGPFFTTETQRIQRRAFIRVHHKKHCEH